MRSVFVQSKRDLLENLFRYRGLVDNARGYEKEALIDRIPTTSLWIVAFDKTSRNWFVAPDQFCGHKKKIDATSYLSEYQQRSITEDRIAQWVQTLDRSHPIYAECESALERMTVYFGTFSGNPCRFSIVQNYEPTMMLGYTFEDLVRRLEHDVSKSSGLSRTARLARLATASPTPNKVAVQRVVFLRNPDVVAEALYLADGKCGLCGCAAPFRKKSDESPYLEVHHKIPLSEGGEDTVENAIALCPNCHRQEHFGVARWP